MKKILFITWDGPETNYVENLFVPIFKQLKDLHGYDFHIIQFTWGDPKRAAAIAQVSEQAGIPYRAITVDRRNAFFGVLKAIYWQSRLLKKYVVDHEIDVIMPRATTSAAIVNHIAKKIKIKYVFDADGFSQDERIDFSGWSETGLKYKMYRAFEKKAITLADAILVRSHNAKKILTKRGGPSFNPDKITVITNGKDSNQYAYDTSLRPYSEGIKFIYVGSLGPKYLFTEMLEIFKTALQRDAASTFTILTGNEDYLKNELTGLSEAISKQIIATRVSPSEVPKYLQNSDIGMALIRPTFSMLGVAPIKLSEYLLCGLPVIANSGIGDTEQVLENKKAAFLIQDPKDFNMDKVISWCFETKGDVDRKKEARQLGLQHFTLDITIERYHEALKNL